MIFEGSEKKAEIIIDPSQHSLLDAYDDVFWQAMVSQCNAQILSSISNDTCKAYLLSESSLFIWHDRLLILTCGVTQLVKSVEFFLQAFNKNAIKQVIYQRKNEYFAPAQFSSFGDDIKLLSQHQDGDAYRFGELDSHHNYLFHANHSLSTAKATKTYELLAYQICKQASNKLTASNISKQQIRDYLQLEKLLPGFILDDFVFSPYGYSINAIKAEQYFTIHVTPQAESSYVSISASFNLIDIVEKLLTILRPNSFDVLSFNEKEFQQSVRKLVKQDYVCQTYVEYALNNSSQVNFATYVVPKYQASSPVKLNIFDENNAL